MRTLTRTETVLTISDLHAPFHHPAALDFLRRLQREYKPTKIVCLGDHADCYAFSGYDKNPDMDSPGVELRKTVAALKPFYKLFPNVLVCDSNHVRRVLNRAHRAGLPSVLMRREAEFLESPPAWVYGLSFEVDGVRYVHGDGFGGPGAALTAAIKYRQSVVIGHVHAHAGVAYTAGPRDVIFGANAGCLMNPKSMAADYARFMASKPVLGTVVVVEGVPYFEPMTEAA